MKPKVVVVGAGMAGLAATYALRKHGIDVTLFEAGPCPGGRVIRKEIEGFRIDLGANFFFETYETTRRIAKDLGVPLRRTHIPIHSGIYREGRFHGLYGDTRPSNAWKTARTLLSFRLLSPKGLWQVAKFARMLRARGDDLNAEDVSGMLDLDTGESAAEFFESNIGTEALDWLFGPGLSGYTFAHPEQVGAACAMAIAWQTGMNGVAWPCQPKGGIGAFVDALVDACGPSIRLSTPVRRIAIEGGIAKGVVTNAGFTKCDAVVCATTAPAAVKIAPDLPHAIGKVLGKVTYSRCCRIFFGVDTSPFPRDWYAVAFPRQAGALMTGMSNAAALAPDAAPQGKAIVDALVIESQADELFALGDAQIRERVLSEIHAYFPTMTGKPLLTVVHRWREALSLAPGGVMTELERLRQQNFEDVRGLFFAGDYFGVPSVNSALRSGLNAASAVVEGDSPPDGE